jgi:hypothetical protein
MRILSIFALTIALSAVPTAASAMTRDDGRMSLGNRAAIADPDARIERVAAANTAQDRDHSRPRKSARNVLKDDPYLREAYGWVDNK